MKVVCVLGTRPEGIKFAPVILELRSKNEFEVTVVSTGQHRDILKPVLRAFDIEPDIDLDIMNHEQTLEGVSIKILEKLPPVLSKLKPDWVLVQGDTTSAYMAALCAFYQKIKVAHIEAGLRTYNKDEPFPEEINRTLISRIAEIHFCPTSLNKKALLKEGISEDKIVVCGNTVVDALYMQIDKIGEDFSNQLVNDFYLGSDFKVLVTAHRRENWGENMISLCKAIRDISHEHKGIKFLFPVHPNPMLRGTIEDLLGDVSGIKIVDPLSYTDFILALKRSNLILTDSGGVQEEAVYLGKRVLVLRNYSDRPESLEGGNVKVVGCSYDRVKEEVIEAFSFPTNDTSVTRGSTIYGHGRARKVICESLIENCGI